MGKVTALGMNVVCEESGHQVVPVAPNMCLTPAAPSPLPLPYPITGTSASLDPGCEHTRVRGKKVLNADGKIEKVTGNEPGTQKDIITFTTGDHAFPLPLPAQMIHFEGKPVAITGTPGFGNVRPGAGPAQTPINLADAGGSAKFSEQCEALLVDAGYDPDDFGSYAHVKKRIEAARARVKAWEEKGKPDPPPNARDVWLAECEAGHMHQNALYQEKRGDDCTNVGDGLYDKDEAPCMPQWGSSRVRCTEHHHVTRKEQRAARERRAAAGASSVYAGALADQDADQRIRELGDEKADRQKDNRKVKRAQTIKGKERAARAAQAARDARAKGDEGRAKKRAAAKALRAARGKAPLPEGEGSLAAGAAECINNWRRQAFEDMRRKILAEAKKNREIAKKNAAEGEPAASKQALADAERKLAEHKLKHPGKRDELAPDHLKERKRLEWEVRGAKDTYHEKKNPGCLAAKAEAWLDWKKKDRTPLGQTPNGRFPGRKPKAGKNATGKRKKGSV